jgi:N-acyl-D-aspartate/D-glutamate deacylase
MYDILIKNGKVFDGSGTVATNVDIGIKDGKVVGIGNFKDEKATTEINADNRFVCPGFIDINNEADHYLDILTSSNAENLIRQGVSTIICGNSGASLAPLISGSLSSIQKWTDFSRVNIDWREIKDFFTFLDKKNPSVNFATLIGWGTLRSEFTHGEFRNLKEEELKKLKSVVNQGIEQGALGVSFGLGYASEQMVGISEILEVGKVVKNKNGYLSFHLRNQSEEFLTSVQEIIEVAEKGGLSTEITHFFTEGKPNFENFEEAIKMIKKANKNTELINFDLFPYDSNAKVLYLILPEWAAVGGREVLLKNIHDEVTRKKIIEDLKRKKYLYKDILIADSGQRWWFSGKTLEEVSKGFNLSLEESLLKIIEICEDRIVIFTKNLLKKNIDDGLKSQYSFVSTDSGFANIDRGKRGIWVHPRAFGAFPKFLGHYVREEKLLSWEEAIHKITGKVAKKVGINDRGLLKKDFWADIVIFNPEKINDKSTLKNPFQYPDGIETVIINGGLVYHKGILTEERHGKTVRK